MPRRLRLASLAVAPSVLVRPLLGAYAMLFAQSLAADAASAGRAERMHGVSLAAVLALNAWRHAAAARRSAAIAGSPSAFAV
ncbi:hypothetical protein P6F26_02175 [Roseibacterium sp. SDUM158017]|uniref:hypothetical protein n=1 Tax=Roseicyclus salinarum TaxID=3036773 RepID=UPI0024155D73|nr:hypothetical protein [Roseibacterium sp. SDUM158017]MDG4647238.1 hypothetical protein [Roseibacterium sp. SDUM158017]